MKLVPAKLEDVVQIRKPLVIAVDGPAASGKGTIGKQLARHFGLEYLDTGSLYREVARLALVLRMDTSDEDRVATLASRVRPGMIDTKAIRTSLISNLAPVIAAMPAVRKALLRTQRAFAKQGNGAVLDGRDIGTVICPEAEVKLFVTASPEVRARRRWLEVGGDEARVLAEVIARDKRDAERAAAPLRPAEDAVLLDTTELSIDAAVHKAIEAIEKRMEQGRA